MSSPSRNPYLIVRPLAIPCQPITRTLPLLPLLARTLSLLCHEYRQRRHVRSTKMPTRARRLLRMSAPQEGGPSARSLALPASLCYVHSLRSGEQILISDSVNRRPGRGHYSRRIGGRRRQVRERTRRTRGRLGVWGCWVRKKRRKRL